jgi:hypothetical protein
MELSSKKWTLILNKHFVPLSCKSVRKTMKYFLSDKTNGKALDPVTYQQYSFDEWIERHNTEDKKTTVATARFFILIPDILIIDRTSLPGGNAKRGFSKRQVFIRDDNTCGYCLKALAPKQRTIDHVIPVSAGGKTSFDNVVTACSECNGAKGDKSLQEMVISKGWKLHHNLSNPSKDFLYNVPISKRLDTWKPFLKK